MIRKILEIVLSLILISVFILDGCGDSLEDPTPPSRPQWVEKSAPEDSIEHGIDADPIDDYIFLEWHPNSDDDISAYKIYRAENNASAKFSLLADVDAFSTFGGDTIYIDDSVELNKIYYYYLLAVDQAGNKSEPSDTIRYGLIQKTDLNYPLIAITEKRPRFEWHDFTSFSYQYIIRVEKLSPLEVIWIYRFNKTNYADTFQSMLFDNNNTASEHELTAGTSYRWRVDAIYLVDPSDRDISGSESQWGYFSIKP
ncbi:MAG: hypothetical protein COT43_09895 [Candidatus Marinimicrobia bacterium CG08_land_8_20_14_0_20_45_22]|nr:MAG: hypothetical protein COT43_09895 [Candidatus Marinimicrobia bacterium CG08_land_8_20_14_0_20_45_22]